MRKIKHVPLSRKAQRVFLLSFLTFVVLASTAFAAFAQSGPGPGKQSPYYARVNTFGFFAAYSNDSSHILLGVAENRMLVEFGAFYSRRLVLNRPVNWQYNAEILPVALESDPTANIVQIQTAPTAVTTVYQYGPVLSCNTPIEPYNFTDPINGTTYSGTTAFVCNGRRWTMGEAISPAGMQWNFLPSRKAQPFLIGHGGYMYSTTQIPLYGAGSFNFTFDLGAGVELFRSKTRSLRAEYRYHHISNNNTAQSNPGIDNGLFQFTYAFGR